MPLADQVRMANQIAKQFEHQPHDEAVASVAGHIRSFWEPRMREQLLALVGDSAEGLDPLVVEAAANLTN